MLSLNKKIHILASVSQNNDEKSQQLLIRL